MANDGILKNPTTAEVSGQSAEEMGVAYGGMMENPDAIVQQKGAGDYAIYREALRDDQVKSCFQQRRLAVVGSEWTVEPGLKGNRAAKKAADALLDNLNRIQFDKVTDQMLYGIYYGHAVAEILWQPNGSMLDIGAIKVRDRARFRYGVDGRLYLSRGTSFKYDQMPDRKFWTFNTGADHGDNPYGLGLGHYVYWPVYFKRNGIRFWLVFLEKFGMPTVVGKLPAGAKDDKATRKKLLEALRAVAVDSGVVVPEGAEVTLLEAARAGAGTYEQMKEAMDAAIAKVILSQTMTTDAAGGNYKGEVHAGVRDMVVKADADLVCDSFNQTVVKWWTEYNFPGAIPPRVYRVTTPPEDLAKRAERDEKIKALGYEPTEEYIKETYGEGWRKSQAAPTIVPGLAGQPGQPNAEPGTNPSEPAASFSEVARLAALKAGNRQDHAVLAEAAMRFAYDYDRVLGERVEQLVNLAETSGDFETFKKHLAELMGTLPPEGAQQAVERASFGARLLGAIRGQRSK